LGVWVWGKEQPPGRPAALLFCGCWLLVAGGGGLLPSAGCWISDGCVVRHAARCAQYNINITYYIALPPTPSPARPNWGLGALLPPPTNTRCFLGCCVQVGYKLVWHKCCRVAVSLCLLALEK
jgi:hypothetical protein